MERERLRVLVQQLRKKIEIFGASPYIVTEHWIGYRFEPFGEAPPPRSTELGCGDSSLNGGLEPSTAACRGSASAAND